MIKAKHFMLMMITHTHTHHTHTLGPAYFALFLPTVLCFGALLKKVTHYAQYYVYNCCNYATVHIHFLA